MGLLDDAIREHLDLKRRRGADPAEVERLEREALGPVRRGPEEPAAAIGDEPVAFEHDEPVDFDHEEPVAFDHEEPVAFDHEEPAGFDPEHEAGWAEHELAPAGGEQLHELGDLGEPEHEEPVHHEPISEPPSAAEEQPEPLRFSEELEPPTAEHAASAAPAPSHEPAPPPVDFEPRQPPSSDELGETVEYDVEHAMRSDEEEDVLEETPEFLQDTPDHDRLWFEQKPPRDFDFDA